MKKISLLFALTTFIFNIASAKLFICCDGNQASYWSTTTIDATGEAGVATQIGWAGGCAGWTGCVQIEKMASFSPDNGGRENTSTPLEATQEMYATMQTYKQLTLKESANETFKWLEHALQLQQASSDGSIEKRFVDLDLINYNLAKLINRNYKPREIKWLIVLPNPVNKESLKFNFRSNENRTVIIKIKNLQNNTLFTSTFCFSQRFPNRWSARSCLTPLSKGIRCSF